ncbi:hypothetical protein H8958_008460 [Nasalis larvatus]
MGVQGSQRRAVLPVGPCLSVLLTLLPGIACQCVAGAMYITGFAESISDLLGLRNIWAVRGISVAVLLALLGINLAGVKWIIRLQLLLLFLLAVSTLDFVVGSFTHLDPGVMAGFNMGGDLREPAASIPLGSLAAVGISWFLYIVFVFLLGAICTREALRYDFLIAEKRGPNKTPVAAICLTSLVTMAFVLVGQVNILAPIVTINFMLTYVAVDYSYFSLSMCSCSLPPVPEPVLREGPEGLHCPEHLLLEKAPSYGSEGPCPKSLGGNAAGIHQGYGSVPPANQKARE